jgi:hypothetical protein
LPAFDALLRRPGPWVGGFDFPFGLPRALVAALGWPKHWPQLVRHVASVDRAAIAASFAAFRAPRPAGRKYVHRACDAASGAHAAMKLVNPPVGLMFRAGAVRLLEAGVHVPGLHDGDRGRVAVEAYPGYLMRSVASAAGVPRAPSYKSDAPSRQTRDRREARDWLLDGLLGGRHALGIAVRLTPTLRRAALDDGAGDTIDAIAAAVQAVWAAQRPDAGYGLPAAIDPLEGWIAGVPQPMRPAAGDAADPGGPIG